MSAKEEWFGGYQFAFKYSATRGSKNGIVSIIWHRASWHLANGMPAIIVGETKVGWDTFHFFLNIAENIYDTYFELTRQGRGILPLQIVLISYVVTSFVATEYGVNDTWSNCPKLPVTG